MAKIYENPEDVLRDQLAKKRASGKSLKALSGSSSLLMGAMTINRAADLVVSEVKPNVFSAVLTGAIATATLASALIWKKSGDQIEKIDEKQKALGPEEVVYPGAQPQQPSEQVQAAAEELLQSNFAPAKSFADRVTPNPEEVATEHTR